MFRAVLLLLMLLSVQGAERSFIHAGESWKVLRAASDGTQPPPAWTQTNYDDSAWPLLPSGFASFPSSDPAQIEQTHLTVSGPTTYCFRKTFSVVDPAFVRWLTLRIDYEDGFVAYLNGQEISRRGFPTNVAVPLNAVSTLHLSGPTEEIDISSATPLLRVGTNVLAIEIHNAFDTDENVRLVAELVPNFSRYPFLQSTTTNSTLVVWKTLAPTTGYVEYGKTLDQLSATTPDSPSTLHVAKLTGLEPGANHQYRVHAADSNGSATTDWISFRPFKMPGSPVTFLVFGDSGQATSGQFAVGAQLSARASEADLVLHMGDILYPYFYPPYADIRFFSIYSELLKSAPFFATLGNHDSISPSPNTGRSAYLDTFYFPTNSATGSETFYSFDQGDIHFISLALDLLAGDRYTPDTAEYQWLEADLRATKQKWKFLFFHFVVRSSSLHSYDDYDFVQGLDKFALQTHIGGLAERYGAQIIFNGHDHNYERFASFSGYNSVVSGGGGAGLYGQYLGEEGSMQFQTRYHFLRVHVDGPDLQWEAIDGDGQIFDRFYRSQVGADRINYPSRWGTPNIEASSGIDPAGNIPGQTFDFFEPSIRTCAGVWANLGRVHVMNDRDFLYVGLEQAAIHENQVIALFVDNPAVPGITDLGPLGNNQLDGTNGEGVDALDMLQKLAFKNFRPSVGCLLGDEFGDGNFRNYQRPRMRWPAGQGVFRLDAHFSDVQGARLQQFSRSPQTPPSVFHESNADLIEVAIPLAELGRAHPGDLLRVGAVAIGDAADGPMEPQIDTAFAGVGLESAGDGRYILEPFTVQLAPDPDPTGDGFQFRGEMIAANRIRFSWYSVPGTTYTLYSATDLREPFQPWIAQGLPLTATLSSASFEMDVDPAAPPRFFRLRAN